MSYLAGPGPHNQAVPLQEGDRVYAVFETEGTIQHIDGRSFTLETANGNAYCFPSNDEACKIRLLAPELRSGDFILDRNRQGRVWVEGGPPPDLPILLHIRGQRVLVNRMQTTVGPTSSLVRTATG